MATERRDALRAESEEPDGRQGSSGDLGAWAQSLLAKAARAGSAMSPWVQRLLATGGASQRHQTAFSERYTHALLDRVSRHAEGGQALRPDIGSVAPATFDRFAGNIVQRFPLLAKKYLPEPPEESSESKAELVLASAGLAGMGAGSEAGRSELQRSPLVEWTGFPESLPPPMAAPAEPPPWLRPTVQRRRDIRPVSRIEELTPGKKTTTPDTETEPSAPDSSQEQAATRPEQDFLEPEAPPVADTHTAPRDAVHAGRPTPGRTAVHSASLRGPARTTAARPAQGRTAGQADHPAPRRGTAVHSVSLRDPARSAAQSA
jgi:hypothetical protein